MLYQLRTVFQHAYQYKANAVHDGIMNQRNNVTVKREMDDPDSNQDQNPGNA